MRNLAALASAVTLMTTFAVFATENVTDTRISLQAAFQRSLDASLIDGALQHVDLATGEVTSFYPVENHPMILRMGDLRILCSDLMSQDGKRVPVDYYFAPAGETYVVIQTEIDNRAPLDALMKAGLVSRLK